MSEDPAKMSKYAPKLAPPPRSHANDLGDMPAHISKLLSAAFDSINAAVELLSMCYEAANPGKQRGEVMSIRESMLCSRSRVETAAARAAMIPNKHQFISPTAGRAGSAETAEAKDAAVRPEVKR